MRSSPETTTRKALDDIDEDSLPSRITSSNDTVQSDSPSTPPNHPAPAESKNKNTDEAFKRLLHKDAVGFYANFIDQEQMLTLPTLTHLIYNDIQHEILYTSKKTIKNKFQTFKAELSCALALPDSGLTDEAKACFKQDCTLIAELIFSAKSNTNFLSDTTILSTDIRRIDRVFHDLTKYMMVDTEKSLQLQAAIPSQETDRTNSINTVLLNSLRECDFLCNTYKTITQKKKRQEAKKSHSSLYNVIENFKDCLSSLANWFNQLRQSKKHLQTGPSFRKTGEALVKLAKTVEKDDPKITSNEANTATATTASKNYIAIIKTYYAELAENQKKEPLFAEDFPLFKKPSAITRVLFTPAQAAEAALTTHLAESRRDLVCNLKTDLQKLKELGIHGFNSIALNDTKNKSDAIQCHIQFYEAFSQKILKFQESLYRIRMQYASYYEKQKKEWEQKDLKDKNRYITSYITQMDKLDQDLLQLHQDSASLMKASLEESEALASDLKVPNIDTVKAANQYLLSFEKTKEISGALTWLENACFDFKTIDQNKFKEEMEARIKMSKKNIPYRIESMHTLTDEVIETLREFVKTKNFGKMQILFHTDKHQNEVPEIKIIRDYFSKKLAPTRDQINGFLSKWDLSQYANLEKETTLRDHDVSSLYEDDEKLSAPINSFALALHQRYVEKLTKYLGNSNNLICKNNGDNSDNVNNPSNTSSFATKKNIRGAKETPRAFQLYDTNIHSNMFGNPIPRNSFLREKEEAENAFLEKHTANQLAEIERIEREIKKAETRAETERQEKEKAQAKITTALFSTIKCYHVAPYKDQLIPLQQSMVNLLAGRALDALTNDELTSYTALQNTLAEFQHKIESDYLEKQKEGDDDVTLYDASQIHEAVLAVLKKQANALTVPKPAPASVATPPARQEQSSANNNQAAFFQPPVVVALNMSEAVTPTQVTFKQG